MRQIITFLGLYPRETTYSFEDKTYKGEVFAEALRQFCDYDSMLVCVTDEAKKTRTAKLARESHIFK
ncbi:hypothetical protein G7B40_021330 [Aetokthonos hydrillicola Thurmond2011]|jgi:hypothetical protein|uniref:Uncharacterized protein n=1 Tax=Aetokthonos hydrillicola Thurmond2011 TaxID=2712845 RepID=A0AAP5IBK3_9CYAN|nr:TM1812 family CRISPR-associated protein [Aetokthonos hydrillicola]MBW4591252.1 hypothetical protein [Aetokthonos hydrillicola CCALA 1050]MDR9897087.1 hypothetical protein [Aetokthonos hydrillicola Thurmond2011]